MILINKTLVDEKITNTHFSCDLAKCKGACCTMSGAYGAPVLEEEIQLMNEALSVAKTYLSEKSIEYIKEEGFVRKAGNDYFTVCIENRDCVFVYYENDIALCSLEKAFLDGKTNFRKPISCHLFPIRVGNFGGKYLYYEKIKECEPALISGERKNIKIYENVKEALIRSFGKDWYDEYVKKINEEK